MSSSGVTLWGGGGGGVMLLGLHTCGDLAASLLKLFVVCGEIGCCVLVGCCYHKITQEAEEGTWHLRHTLPHAEA